MIRDDMTRIAVTLPPALVRDLDHLADYRRKHRAHLVAEAVALYLEHPELRAEAVRLGNKVRAKGL